LSIGYHRNEYDNIGKNKFIHFFNIAVTKYTYVLEYHNVTGKPSAAIILKRLHRISLPGTPSIDTNMNSFTPPIV
jgi:hypothetical protein